MTSPISHRSGRKVEQIFGSTDPSPVSDELGKLTAMLTPLCPKDSVIRFGFDGKLHLHLDLRAVSKT